MIHNGPAGTCFHLSQQCPDLHTGYYFSPTCLKYILSFLPLRPSIACEPLHLLWRVPRCSSPDGNRPGFYSIITLFNTLHISRSDFTMCQSLHWSPLPSPQIRCQLKLTPAHEISRTLIHHVSATTWMHADKKCKLSADPFLCFDFLRPTLWQEEKDCSKYFHPIFCFKDISLSFHGICESGFMCCQYFAGAKILFGVDMACSENSDCR